MNNYQSLNHHRKLTPAVVLFCSMLLFGCGTPPGYYDESHGMAFNSVEPYWVYEREFYVMPPYQPYPSDYYPRQVTDESSTWSVERRRNARPMPMPTAPVADPPPTRQQQQEISSPYANSSVPADRPIVDLAPKTERIEPLKPTYQQ
jgi:hypothetical protein